jgi:hypothetical protein
VEAQDLVFVAGDDENRWLMDVDLFLELPIEERALDVHVMDCPMPMHCKCHQHPHRLQSHHRSEDLVEVKLGVLHVPLHDKSSLVSHDVTVFIVFHLVDPLQLDGSMTCGKSGELPCLVSLDVVHLFTLGCSPWNFLLGLTE